MMFSTRAGEALPVRTPANSCCTTSSVFIIFSSASNKMSSRVIVLKDYQKRLKGQLPPFANQDARERASSGSEATVECSAPLEESLLRIKLMDSTFHSP